MEIAVNQRETRFSLWGRGVERKRSADGPRDRKDERLVLRNILDEVTPLPSELESSLDGL